MTLQKEIYIYNPVPYELLDGSYIDLEKWNWLFQSICK